MNGTIITDKDLRDMLSLTDPVAIAALQSRTWRSLVEALLQTREQSDAWQPPVDRPNGYRCLALHKGEWAFATWRIDRWWVGGYPFNATVFAELPPPPYPVVRPYMGQIIAECDCSHPDRCTRAEECLADRTEI